MQAFSLERFGSQWHGRDVTALHTPRLDLGRSLTTLLNFAANRLNSTASAAYRARVGIGVTEARLLIVLALEPDIFAARICDITGMDTGGTSRTLRGLETRGLVVQRPDDQNRAYRRWSLTAAGSALQEEAMRIALERDSILSSIMSEDEKKMLLGLLKRILLQTSALASVADVPDKNSGSPKNSAAHS